MRSSSRNAIFILSSLFLCREIIAQDQRIMINQAGFYRGAPKIAIVVGAVTAVDFALISDVSQQIVFKGQLGPERASQNSSLVTLVADFSSYSIPGRYRVSVPGLGNSYPFTIGDRVMHEVAVASLKGFYFQRSSIPLEKAFAGQWARPAGHPDTAVLVHASAASAARPEGTIISTAGGWYDAGDYNKYIVNSGITMGTLLSAYEDFPSYFDTLNTNIPESRNKLPDLLDEILYNLRWMLTMQDPVDGGVYHKCSNARFDGMVMPGVTDWSRYVVQKGTAATLDFAAVCAQAARILIPFSNQLPGLRDSCLQSALAAWQWAEKNPAIAYNQDEINKQFKPAITTGAYGDNRFGDERFWAACELYTTTGDEKYYELLKTELNEPLSLPQWANVKLSGYYSLCRDKKFREHHVQDWNAIRKQLIGFAGGFITGVQKSAFQTVMGQNPGDFIWGSNSVAANQGILLINAYLLTRQRQYLNAALSNLDYILGRNATGYCFVTGIGSKSPLHPHHRPSGADGIEAPVPGLLAGGPNPGMQDKCVYEYSEPERAYSDTNCSYASNEIAINWNAPLVYLANALEVLQSGKYRE